MRNTFFVSDLVHGIFVNAPARMHHIKKICTRTLLLLLLSHCTVEKEMEGIPQVFIPLSSSNTLNLTDAVDSIRFIPLSGSKEGKYINRIQRLASGKNSIAVLNLDQRVRSLMLFDTNGIFRKEIMGVDTTFKLAMDLIYDNGSYEVLDGLQRKIFKFTSTGEFEKVINSPDYWSYFQKTGDEEYVFYADNTPTEMGLNFNISQYNYKTKKLKNAVPFIPEIIDNGAFQQRLFKVGYQDKVLFKQALDNLIYKIDSKGIAPLCEIKFERGNIDPEFVKMTKGDPNKIIDIFNDKELIPEINSYFDLGNKIFISYFYRREPYWSIIDTKTYEAVSFKPKIPFIKQNLLSYHPVEITKDGFLVFIIEAFELVDYLNENRNNLNNFSTLGALKNTITYQSNPILMLIKIRF